MDKQNVLVWVAYIWWKVHIDSVQSTSVLEGISFEEFQDDCNDGHLDI